MDKKEYETELKNLYEKAHKSDDIRLAWDLLEAGRRIGFNPSGPKYRRRLKTK